jgi:hypothetical protein
VRCWTCVTAVDTTSKLRGRAPQKKVNVPKAIPVKTREGLLFGLVKTPFKRVKRTGKVGFKRAFKTVLPQNLEWTSSSLAVRRKHPPWFTGQLLVV